MMALVRGIWALASFGKGSVIVLHRIRPRSKTNLRDIDYQPWIISPIPKPLKSDLYVHRTKISFKRRTPKLVCDELGSSKS